MVTVINLLILFFILLIGYQIYLNYFRTTVIEGMLDVIPSFVPTFSPNMSPTESPIANPTNEMLPNLTVNQVYRQYDKKISDNTFLLAQQNAGNIEYLKQRVNVIQDMADEVNQLSSDVDSLQQQVSGLVQANTQYTTQNLGTTPPDISGAVDSNTTQSTTDFVT
jgi:uncharacterized protein YoxC